MTTTTTKKNHNGRKTVAEILEPHLEEFLSLLDEDFSSYKIYSGETLILITYLDMFQSILYASEIPEVIASGSFTNYIEGIQLIHAA